MDAEKRIHADTNIYVCAIHALLVAHTLLLYIFNFLILHFFFFRLNGFNGIISSHMIMYYICGEFPPYYNTKTLADRWYGTTASFVFILLALWRYSCFASLIFIFNAFHQKQFKVNPLNFGNRNVCEMSEVSKKGANCCSAAV